MPNASKLAKKQEYFDKLIDLVEKSPQALIVEVDNVGSKAMQNIRTALRGEAILLMGKNTMIRTALRKEMEKRGDESLKNLLDNIQGNIGFIFMCPGTSVDRIKDVLNSEKVPAAAKGGIIAPVNVIIPKGITALEPSQTSFFQALNINTKIVKSLIEILSDVQVCTVGDKCSLSAVALLNKMGIKPFEYGMKIKQVYQDGSVFDAAVLDITNSVLISKFMSGVANVAALSREVGIPTEASLPHMMANAFKNVAALVAEIDFTFKEVEDVKKFIADPSAFAAAAGPAAGAPAAGGAAAPAAAAVEEEEEEEEMEFDLFD